MDILIVAPAVPPALDTAPEIARVASGNSPMILDRYVSRGRLASALRERQYDVVHFAGHGDYDVGMMSDGPVAAGELITMLQPQCRLKLVVLNACRSAGTAAALHDALHVPVVMYQCVANDLPSVRYAEALYDGLAQSVPLHEAHERARDVIRKIFDVDECDLPALINGTMNDIERQISGLEERMRRVEEILRRQWLRDMAMLGLLLLIAVGMWFR